MNSYDKYNEEPEKYHGTMGCLRRCSNFIKEAGYCDCENEKNDD